MQQTSITTDFLVVGGGVMGINIARGLKKRYTTSKVTLIEKEDSCGMHASGRNSGVLHAGFYYTPDSLKAKFTRDGNARLTANCEEKRISLNRCGKLVVAKDSADLSALDELLKRGKASGIELEELSEQDAKKIEPRVKTFQRALFSPTTSTVNPNTVLQAMVADAIADGVQINSGVAFKTGRTVQTTGCRYEAGYVVNAAGLYADQLARQFEFSERYRILPFKGLYLYSDEPPGARKTNVYPVPDLQNPFLGVHFTVTNYLSLTEFVEIAGRGLSLLGAAGFEFRRLAFEEVKKYSRRRMVRLAGELVDGVRLENYSKWGRPWICAQLLDIKKRRLEMDFVVEGDDRSMHVFNAVSPAFTCSLPFADYVCDRISVVLN